ncbi:MAG: pyruvate kinase [Candidatus Moranbacteria bacterium]|nr:pyruvate kinase [Candidatus Moranbacteria bacterium]
MKKTKIVATIGPASDSKETLRELIQAGLNVCRINFSHGTYDSNGKVITEVRELSKELNVPVGIMVDLQGPRIRTVVSEDVEIKNGEYIWVSDVSVGDNFKFEILNFKSISNDKILNKKILLDWPEIVNDINIGESILIEDGLKRLKVVEKEGKSLVAQVINGGIIKNHKGVNVPDSKLKIGAVTKKDEEDLAYAMSREVDFIALSFVSNGQEIEETREKMRKLLGRDDNLPQIVAKIERKEAIKNIDEIIAATDVIMVARGDLGIEMDETKVVIYQKEIIAKCIKAVRPVIVATQMLESMIQNPIPTRAEVSDVSNAVIDHTDAVMLSGESANGKFPQKAVETMSQIISDTEDSRFDDVEFAIPEDDKDQDYVAIIDSAYNLAKQSQAKAIVALTVSGLTARLISHFRPMQSNFVATTSEKVYNQLSLVWGVESYLLEDTDKEKLIENMLERLEKEDKIKAGDKVVVVLGRIPGGEKMRLVGIREIM